METYCYNMKQTIDDDKIAQKLSSEDKKVIADICDESLRWLDSNQMADKVEYDHKLKETEHVCNPVITRLYQGSEGGAPGGTAPQKEGPKIDEVD